MVLVERVSMVLLHMNPLVEEVVERRDVQQEDLRDVQQEDLRDGQQEDLRDVQQDVQREDLREENKFVIAVKFKFEK